jgi:hypothetical protein
VNGSGDKDPHDGKHGTFDGVFGGADTVLYGWMNLFFFQNIREHRLDLVLDSRRDNHAAGRVSLFHARRGERCLVLPWCGAQRRDKTGDSSGRELGHEVDLTAKKEDFLNVWKY